MLPFLPRSKWQALAGDGSLFTPSPYDYEAAAAAPDGDAEGEQEGASHPLQFDSAWHPPAVPSAASFLTALPMAAEVAAAEKAAVVGLCGPPICTILALHLRAAFSFNVPRPRQAVTVAAQAACSQTPAHPFSVCRLLP